MFNCETTDAKRTVSTLLFFKEFLLNYSVLSLVNLLLEKLNTYFKFSHII